MTSQSLFIGIKVLHNPAKKRILAANKSTEGLLTSCRNNKN